MKIFFLDVDPKKSAENLIDKHLGLQGVYLCQLLSAAHRGLDGIREERSSRVSGQKEHRYVIAEPLQSNAYDSVLTIYHAADFVKQSTGHYFWAHDYLMATMKEFEKRYGQKHDHLELAEMLRHAPTKMFKQELQEGWLFMPAVDSIEPQYTARDEDGVIDLVQTYRNWYKFAQPGVMRWTKTKKPTWYN